MMTNSQKPVSSKQLSIRINPELRELLDYLNERTGLKDAQVVRMAVKQFAGAVKVLEEQARAVAATKPARKTR
jgi:predicted DNA-binding protein